MKFVKTIMKQLIYLGFLSLFFSCKGQDMFEGEIIYKLSFKPENAKIDTMSLRDFYGEQWTFLFKNGNSRWNMDSSNSLIATVYDEGKNRHYYLIKNSEVVSWKKGSQKTDSILSMKTVNTETKILTHSCQLLEIKSKLLINNILRTRLYYYSSDLRVDPKWYAKNQDGNFNEIYSRMKAIPLKIIDDFGTFSITYEAIQIIPKRVDDSNFEINSSHFLEVK